MTKIFISYRRDDSAGHAGRLHDRLVHEFGRDLLFMDVDAIPLGVNMAQVLEQEVAKCDVLLAVIGPSWLDVREESGSRRLDQAADYVRVEVGAALQRNIPVIPILLDGTRMPKPEQLPADMRELTLRNALNVRHTSFHADMDTLVQNLKRSTEQPATLPKATPGETRFAVPETRYARSGNISIAFQVVGDGPIDLVLVPGWISNVEAFWEEPRVSRFLQELASFSRLIIFDKRGTGLSDRVTEAATLEERMDDLRAVMDAADSTRAALFGYSEGGAMCALFAVTYPERTTALITSGCFPRRTSAPDWPWGPSREEFLATSNATFAAWGGPVGLEKRAASVANDEVTRQWWSKFLRSGASPSAALAISKLNAETDFRYLLPSIRVPTLIIHAAREPMPIEVAKYMAEKIPGAKLVIIDSGDHLPFFEGADDVVRNIREFVRTATAQSVVENRVVTLMFIDMAATNKPSSEIEKKASSGFFTSWRRREDAIEPEKIQKISSDVLRAHQATVRKQLALYRGTEIEATDSGFLASFDGPARAVRCGRAIAKDLTAKGLSCRIGLHTGECEVRDARLSGMALDVARAVAALAPPASVLVSQTVRDLVAGADLKFTDMGSRKLQDLADERHIFAVLMR